MYYYLNYVNTLVNSPWLATFMDQISHFATKTNESIDLPDAPNVATSFQTFYS